MIEMTEQELVALLSKPKWVKSGRWEQRVNHAGHVIWFAEVFDESDATMPGVTVSLEVKEASPVDTCLQLFTLHLKRGMTKRRLYQLEVVHTQKRSHNGPDGAIYGPHEHIGEYATFAIEDANVKCDNWAGSLAMFARRAGVNFLVPVESPC